MAFLGMNRCPHCGMTPCLPLWRKLTLGPAVSARCRVCGLKVSVSAVRAYAVMLPLLVVSVIASMGLVQDKFLLAGFLALVFGATCVAYAQFVPLRTSEPSNPEMVQAGRDRIAVSHAKRLA